jgi:hypothetical protein
MSDIETASPNRAPGGKTAPRNKPEATTTEPVLPERPPLEEIKVGDKPNNPGISMTPEQLKALQEEMYSTIRSSSFGQAYVHLLNNPTVSITIGNTGGALGAAGAGPNNSIEVELSRRRMNETYGELLAQGYSAKEAVQLTALRMVPVLIHELQHTKNYLAQIRIIGAKLTATPRQEETTGHAAGAAMYAELLSNPLTGPKLRNSFASLDENLQTALSQWQSGLSTLEREWGGMRRYSILDGEYDKMLAQTKKQPMEDREAAERVIRLVNRKNFQALAQYYAEEYARLAPPPK